jgi:hypothetical protein
MTSDGEQALASDRTDGDPQPIGWNGAELKSLWAIAGAGARQAPAAPSVESPPDPAPAKVERFFLWNAGQADGPHDREELEKRVAAGHLKFHDFVKPDGDGEWIPVSVAISRTTEASVRNWGAMTKPAVAAKAAIARDVDLSVSGRDTSPVIAAARMPEQVKTAPVVDRPPQPKRTDVDSAPTVPVRTAAKPSVRPATAESSLTGVRSSPLMRLAGRAWTKLEQTIGRQRLRRGLVALAVIATVVTYFVWPPSSSAIYDSFLRCRVEMETVQAKGAMSSEWQQFSSSHRPKIESLVMTLRNRAAAGRPADQELLWAGERCLLPMLKEGPSTVASMNPLFNTHMRNARRILDGGHPADGTNSSTVASAAPVFYSPSPPGTASAGGPTLGHSAAQPGATQPAASRGRN